MTVRSTRNRVGVKLTGTRRRPVKLAGAPPAAVLRTTEHGQAIARELYTMRRRRGRHLPDDLFGEPTWDILLDLYLAIGEGRRVPTTSACIGAHVPPTTALRWLRILETRGMVEREDDGRDGRRTFVRLTASGLKAMDDVLESTWSSMCLMLTRFSQVGAPELPRRTFAEAAE